MKIEIKTSVKTSICKSWMEGNLKRKKKVVEVFDEPYLANEIRYIVEKYYTKKI